MAGELVVCVADAGSVAKSRFHWVSSRDLASSSTDPRQLAAAIAADLEAGLRVALGYESPLFVPEDDDSALLGKARVGECQPETGNRPFTAGAGAAVLATGIQSLAWVLREIKRRSPQATGTTRWHDFVEGKNPLLVWEAFVSGSEKASPPSHAGDASLAIAAFHSAMERTSSPSCISTSAAFSLAGAAIIWAGLSADVSLLGEPCIVLRPVFSQEEANRRMAAFRLRQAESQRARAIPAQQELHK